MAFSPREVAEQLTVIDAALFKNVVPSEYLSSTWGKRTQPGHENVAPTVRATVVQFNRVANCVMTSCLGDPNMTAQGQGQGPGAVDRGGQGVPSLEELFLLVRHRLGSAEHAHIPTEQDLGESVQEELPKI
ncbi:ral-GDS-related protein-like [Equus przewalskii]|uniref:Ral-GDS-related protein-like n=1 Tax=Equus przewalskii TaxID=9798 RepID=A0ABM4KMH7_EQUPR